MEIVDSMPNGSSFKADWEQIADLLNEDRVIKFTENDDFPQGKVTAFRTVLVDRMRERNVLIKTRRAEGGVLYVTSKA